MSNTSGDGAVVLLSGGLDSTVALADVLTRRPVACALTFDYGQRAAKQELKATRAIADHYDLHHRVIPLPWLGELLPQALMPSQSADAALDALKSTPKAQWDSLSQAELFDVNRVWVPNRNGLFLNIAACFAEALGVKTLVFGANAEEGESFPDNTPEFRDQLNTVFEFSTLNHVRVETPVGHLNKMQIIERGIALKVPFSLIWSCYEGDSIQCGHCPSCLRVKEAQQRVEAAGQKAGIGFKNA